HALNSQLDNRIEIQILRNADDAFSELLFSGLGAHGNVELDGPYGKFVLEDASTRPLIFVAFGVGFAPIKSLIQHAMSLDLAESMDLHWLADEAGHYQNNLCRAWTDALDNFSYVPHAHSDDVEANLANIVSDYPDLHRFDVYAAGTTGQLQIARRLFLEHGLPEQQWRDGSIDM
ncbi:MAG: flavodoxin oxidoreductase, partial [Gallionella sp.]